MAVLWGLFIAYIVGCVGVLLLIRRRTPSDATLDRRQANGRIVVGLVFVGAVLSIGISLYFAA